MLDNIFDIIDSAEVKDNKFPLAKVTTCMFNTLFILPAKVDTTYNIQHNKLLSLMPINTENYITHKSFISEDESFQNLIKIDATTLKEYNKPKYLIDKFIITYPNYFIISEHQQFRNSKKLFSLNNNYTEFQYICKCNKSKKYFDLIDSVANKTKVIETLLTDKNYMMINRNLNFNVLFNNIILPKLNCVLSPADRLYFLSNNKWELLPYISMFFRTSQKYSATYLTLPNNTYLKLQKFKNLTNNQQNFNECEYYFIDKLYNIHKITENNIQPVNKIVIPYNMNNKYHLSINIL